MTNSYINIAKLIVLVNESARKGFPPYTVTEITPLIGDRVTDEKASQFRDTRVLAADLEKLFIQALMMYTLHRMSLKLIYGDQLTTLEEVFKKYHKKGKKLDTYDCIYIMRLEMQEELEGSIDLINFLV